MPHSICQALHSALRAPFAQPCLRFHSNSLQPQPVALMARQQPASAVGCSRCSKPAFAASCISLSMKALHSALKGSVCAAMLSLPRQQPAVAAGCFRCSKPAFAASCTRSSLQAPHTSPEGLRYRCSAWLFVARQQPAFAAGCIWCSKSASASSCTLLSTQRCTPP